MNIFKETANHFNYLSKDNKQLNNIEKASEVLISCILNKGKIFFAGNGGSFSDSQHISSEFIGRLNFDREPLPAICLGSNSSSTTSIGNDYGFESIFSRELKALFSKNDILVALSTSGESKNIIELLKTAQELEIITILITGPNESASAVRFADICINTPPMCKKTYSIQHLHIAIGHYLCEKVQTKLLVDKENYSSL